MLYDKRWDKPEVKADPFSLENLIAWIEQQDPRKKYDYYCQGECLLGQWVQHLDPNAHAIGRPADIYRYMVNGQDVDLNKYGRIAQGAGGRWTFGSALARARAMQALS